MSFGYSHKDTSGLPSWFERPRSAQPCQCSLFAEPLVDVLVALRVSPDDLARWHKFGWVSFGPDRTEHMEESDVDEVRFVRDVARSGLSDAFIDRLFGELSRPMNFDPDAVAFSFAHGWVRVAPVPEPEAAEVVDLWLEELAEAGDKDRLQALRDRIDELLTPPDESNEASE